jgi:hypothetical protein
MCFMIACLTFVIGAVVGGLAVGICAGAAR